MKFSLRISNNQMAKHGMDFFENNQLKSVVTDNMSIAMTFLEKSKLSDIPIEVFYEPKIIQSPGFIKDLEPTQAVKFVYKKLKTQLENLKGAVFISPKVMIPTEKTINFDYHLITSMHKMGYKFTPCRYQMFDFTHARMMRLVVEKVLEANTYFAFEETYDLFPYLWYPNHFNLHSPGSTKILSHVPFPRGESKPGEEIGRYRKLSLIAESEWKIKNTPFIAITKFGIEKKNNSISENYEGYYDGMDGWQDRTNIMIESNRIKKPSDLPIQFAKDINWCEEEVYSDNLVHSFHLKEDFNEELLMAIQDIMIEYNNEDTDEIPLRQEPIKEKFFDRIMKFLNESAYKDMLEVLRRNI